MFWCANNYVIASDIRTLSKYCTQVCSEARCISPVQTGFHLRSRRCNHSTFTLFAYITFNMTKTLTTCIVLRKDDHSEWFFLVRFNAFSFPQCFDTDDWMTGRAYGSPEIDWVKVLRRTQHNVGHFRDILQANLLAWYGKTKPNTKKHAFTNQNKCTTTQN